LRLWTAQFWTEFSPALCERSFVSKLAPQLIRGERRQASRYAVRWVEFSPTDFTDDVVLLTFWREGRMLREIRVRDFIPDHHILKQTASHYLWGKVDGIDPQGRLKVERADGKIFFFDVSTGKTKEA
jgi:hypothetical protein